MLKNYYRLTKPGLVYGNVFTTIAGFLYASRWQVTWIPFIATILGMTFVIASACVYNNVLDRKIDRKMARTKNRALVTGRISIKAALFYASVLLLAGLASLYIYVNALTAAIALFGHLWYVFAYGWGKRASHWGTHIGAIAGAVPITAGYTAVVGHFDLTAVLIFLALALWQMPHFFAIALYRYDDYKAAGIPTLPIRKGIHTARVQIVFYIVLFVLMACALTAIGSAGYIYAAIVVLAGITWLIKALRGFRAADEKKWARGVFFYSLIVLLVYSLELSLARLLP
jgi:protoheme IX farnesyltransferase